MRMRFKESVFYGIVVATFFSGEFYFLFHVIFAALIFFLNKDPALIAKDDNSSLFLLHANVAYERVSLFFFLFFLFDLLIFLNFNFSDLKTDGYMPVHWDFAEFWPLFLSFLPL